MAPPDYDVLVLGGGIQGAGVAQAATAAGHSVLVVEKSDVAAETSSRSSKLIHGGLRYLESGQLRRGDGSPGHHSPAYARSDARASRDDDE